MEQHSARPPFSDGGLDVEDALEALGDERQRAVVRLLDGVGAPMTLAELTTEMITMSDAPSRDPERVRTDLHHCTLPKLDALGVIDYDSAENVAEPRDELDDLAPLVDYVAYTASGR